MSEARAVLAEATARLARAGIGNAAGDALALMAHALDVPRHALRDALNHPLPPGAAETLARASAKVPLGCASNSWLEALEHKLADE